VHVAGEAYGGAGMEDYRYDQILIEELLHVDSGFFMALHNRVVGPLPHINLATDEQKARWLPGCVSGDIILSIAMTEPGTGSDLAGMKTRAEDKGDHWLLNGSKTYISNGLISNLCVVAARTSPDSPHAVACSWSRKACSASSAGASSRAGLHSQDTAELFFQDVKVPRSQCAGRADTGLS